MEMNSRLELAAKIIEKTGCSLFLTGKAGTGKTTFLRNLRASSRKRMVVTAPTGIAAINAGGMTLHSFFQLDFGPFVPGARRESANRRSMAFSKEKIRIIRGLDLLVIDEISMVRSDMLDAVDDVLRRFRDRTLPFGGVQLLLIGDLQQLPPVVVESERAILEANYRSPYFFDSHALSQLGYVTVELQKVYRQSDTEFLDILNAVRDNRADMSVLARLNSRHIAGFNPPDSEGYVRLTTHNRMANEINRARLAALPSPSFTFRANVQGNFPESSYPAEAELELKEGAQVMFIKNDTGTDRRFFNGMLGRVTAIDEDSVIVTPADSDEQIDVEPMEWENVRFVVNEETKEITEQREGVFRQLPLKTAWAITIHKSQGLTFDRAIIDATSSFTHGQTYVALSRCRTLDGLVLERPIPPSAIINDPTVTRFIEQHKSDGIDDRAVESMSHLYYLSLAEGMFNFRPLFSALEGVIRLLQENFMKLYPAKVQETASAVEGLRDSMVSVGERFIRQLRQIDAQAEGSRDNPQLTQRIKDASSYFFGQLRKLRDLVADLPSDHDNRKVTQKLSDRIELFESMADIREALLDTFSEEDFNVENYLEIKARGAFRSSQKKRKRRIIESSGTELSADNHHPALMDRLREWRSAKASESAVPAYTVCTTKSLLAISNHLPQNYDELRMMPGIGPATVKRYGDEILDLIDAFMAEADDLIMIPLPEKKSRKRKSETDDTDRDGAAEAKKQASKGDSAKMTCEMFLAGKSVSEICEERQLKPNTIENHLLSGLDMSDAAVVSRLVDAETWRRVGSYLNKTDTASMTLSEIREAIGGDISWFELRVSIAYHNSVKS